MPPWQRWQLGRSVTGDSKLNWPFVVAVDDDDHLYLSSSLMHCSFNLPADGEVAQTPSRRLMEVRRRRHATSGRSTARGHCPMPSPLMSSVSRNANNVRPSHGNSIMSLRHDAGQICSVVSAV